MRRFVTSFVAAALLGTPVVAVEAAPSRTLVIEASGSAFVDIAISRPIVFDLDNATFRGGRRYAGVVLDRIGPDTKSIQLLHVRFPEVVAAPSTDATLGHVQDERPLPAGTYRLYALSDGAVRFSIPVSGPSRDLRITPTRRVAPRYRGENVPQVFDPPAGTPYGGHRRIPGVTSGPGHLTVARFGAVFEPRALTADGWNFCFTPRETDCAQPPGMDGHVVGLQTSGTTVDTVTYLPPDYLDPGTYDLIGGCRAQAPAKRCRFAVLDRFVSPARSDRVVRL